MTPSTSHTNSHASIAQKRGRLKAWQSPQPPTRPASATNILSNEASGSWPIGCQELGTSSRHPTPWSSNGNGSWLKPVSAQAAPLAARARPARTGNERTRNRVLKSVKELISLGVMQKQWSMRSRTRFHWYTGIRINKYSFHMPSPITEG